MDFDPISAINAAKQERQLRKARNYKKRVSKLEPDRHEIVRMYLRGASLELIAIHLHRKHQLRVARSSISRYLKTVGVSSWQQGSLQSQTSKPHQ